MENEKWGYKIGEKVIKDYRNEEYICTIVGFTKSYVKVDNGDLFSPKGFHIARGCGDRFFSTTYAKATDEEIQKIISDNRRKRLALLFGNIRFDEMTIEELTTLYDSLPERYRSKK